MNDAGPVVADVIGDATARIAEVGIASPRRVALRLWRELGHAPGIDAVIDRDAAVDSEAAARYVGAVGRIVSGEPMQYVTGRTGFRRLTLRSDPRALIPRPETEGLVEAALARVRTGRAADIGTGTGAIALSLRLEGAFDEVVGIDASADALALARENGLESGLDVRWIVGDLVAPLGGTTVDLLVSNPPYLSAPEYASLDASVRDHEPALALASGADGLEATRRLLADGLDVVVPGGWIALEVDHRRADATSAIAAAAGWTDVVMQDDLFGRARYVLARREMQ